MNLIAQWVAFSTIVRNELKRVFRLWVQTLLPPAVTTTLYFVIFGHIIGSRIGTMHGHRYINYIAPGLIMMSIITNSYGAAVSSFFSAKFQRSIEEMLVSPVKESLILLGFMTGGLLRGVIIGLMVSTIAIFFTGIHIYSLISIISVALIASCIFSLAGIINAIFARSFDDISIVPNFVLTPLTYLGGVFYSVSMLPSFWKYISMANPIVYIVNTFRFGFLGIDKHQVTYSFFIMITFIIAFYFLALYLFKKGIGLRE